MTFEISNEFVLILAKDEAVKTLEGYVESLSYLKSRVPRFSSDQKDVVFSFDSQNVTSDIILKLAEYGDKFPNMRKAKTFKALVKAWLNISHDTKFAKIKNLRVLHAALTSVIKGTKNHYIFKKDNNDQMLPYFVSRIEYYPAFTSSGIYHPAHTDLIYGYLVPHQSDSSRTVAFYLEELRGGIAVEELLANEAFVVETDELMEKYAADMKIFHKYRVMIGEQFLASGMAESGDSENSRYRSWGSRSNVALDVDGKGSRVVVDVEKSDLENKYTTNYIPWEDLSLEKKLENKSKKVIGAEKPHDKDEDSDQDVDYSDDLSDEAGHKLAAVVLPIHPYIRVFNLMSHSFFNVHASCLVPYVYDPSLKHKLILPEKQKNLINILINSAGDVLEDIIKGKSGGIIILATGQPGTGKTLTAEVYSEVIKRPLYSIQSSQLGVTPEELESNLAMILSRAVRWKAILQIDECDVYLHERGDNLVQNAVVGVFLRLLEYYKGILFLTTNRESLIDDAIISRATAWIKYERPTGMFQRDIWRVLSEQFNVELAEDVLVEVTKTFPHISGRDIKNILKLSRALLRGASKKKVERPVITLDTLTYAATFQGIDIKEL